MTLYDLIKDRPGMPKDMEILNPSTSYRFGKSTQHSIWVRNQQNADWTAFLKSVEIEVDEEMVEKLIQDVTDKENTAWYLTKEKLDRYSYWVNLKKIYAKALAAHSKEILKVNEKEEPHV